MTPSEHRSPIFGRGLLAGAALFVCGLSSGCVHSAPSGSAAPAVRDLCVGVPAASGAAAPGCTAAQRVCFLVREIPAAFTQTDFLPDASYGTRFRPQVEQWRLQLTALTKESALETYAHAVHRKLMWLDSSEHDRRLSIENGDVLHVLSVLVRKAKDALPNSGIDCALAEQ